MSRKKCRALRPVAEVESTGGRATLRGATGAVVESSGPVTVKGATATVQAAGTTNVKGALVYVNGSLLP